MTTPITGTPEHADARWQALKGHLQAVRDESWKAAPAHRHGGYEARELLARGNTASETLAKMAELERP